MRAPWLGARAEANDLKLVRLLAQHSRRENTHQVGTLADPRRTVLGSTRFRGPTTVANLSPRSRRCHRYKTAGLWHVHARTDPHGHVTAHRWTSPLGAHQVVQVPPLPGHAPGEAYAGSLRGA